MLIGFVIGFKVPNGRYLLFDDLILYEVDSIKNSDTDAGHQWVDDVLVVNQWFYLIHHLNPDFKLAINNLVCIYQVEYVTY